MTTRRVEKDETFFHIRIVDLEGGSIRFGPFTLENAAQYAGADALLVTFEDLAGRLTRDVETLGVKQVLEGLEIDFGYTVFVTGDDGNKAVLLDRTDV